ncbi:hypothetical protein, partial [Pseudomonas sp. BF-R-16]|uniref:hypothetical protein n=1 Tax=Pseudomonas sp. BF-R-16 TaxID=2832362 RepID=UPI001CC16CAA
GGIKAFRVNEFWGEVISASGGLGDGFFMAYSSCLMEPPFFVSRRKGGSYARAGKPRQEQNPADPKVSHAQPP